MTGTNLKVFLISKWLKGDIHEPLLVFLEKDINQANLIFEEYAENYKTKENFALRLIGEFVKNEIKSKNIVLKRIYKNIKKIQYEYEQKKIPLNNYILKQDKHNMVDNLISVFRGKIVK